MPIIHDRSIITIQKVLTQPKVWSVKFHIYNLSDSRYKHEALSNRLFRWSTGFFAVFTLVGQAMSTFSCGPKVTNVLQIIIINMIT